MQQSFFSRFFPTPKFLRLGTVGLDFSDAGVRLMELEQTPAGLLPKRFAEAAIPEGIVEGGKIADEQQFILFLRDFKKKHRFRFACVSISEPQVYSFTLPIDRANKNDIRDAIEFVFEDYIPLKLADSVFDYAVIGTTKDGTLIVQVTAMNAVTAGAFVRVLSAAGIVPVRFELEGAALARAVLAADTAGSSMVVDFGMHRTSLAIVTGGAVVFTATIDFGGNHVTEAVAKSLGVSFDEAERLKRSIGLSSPHESRELFETLTAHLSVLKDEINRRYIYWHEKRQFPEVLPNVERMILAGGDSMIRGLDEYLRAALRLPVELANPWQACVSFDDAIPELTREQSMRYGAAIGLALAEMRAQ